MSMPDTSTPRPTGVAALTKSLRLPGEAETLALLKTDALTEAFRKYRNRCLASRQCAAARLPDWKDVDEYLYELRLSSDFRRRGCGKQGKGAESAGLREYLAKLCFAEPYLLMPHVAMFALRVREFLESREGRRFDGAWEDAKACEGPREVVFDRYERIMSILAFLVARDIG